MPVKPKKFYENIEELTESSATRMKGKLVSHLRENIIFTAKQQLPLLPWVKKYLHTVFLCLVRQSCTW